jgi:LmbE family N-acetylglucosaminyl deacetylase
MRFTTSRFAVAVAVCFLLSMSISLGVSAAEEPERPLRIICFGAHPDDAEFKAGGVAALWASLGHKVKFVSVTNGDIGHWQKFGPELAARRKAEVTKAAQILGIETEVLDIHDGELLPTLENRLKITRVIRQWQADIVMSHRPNDYHPDHRYTGVLVQDAAFMVTVPFITPETPVLKHNPVFLFYSDYFQKPNPFTPDIAVSIDSVFQKKIDAVDALVSQVYEGGASGSDEFVRRVPSDAAGRREWAVTNHGARYKKVADQFRQGLIQWYGDEAGKKVQFAEAFEICEYGRRPAEEELRKLFPFLPPKK